jgi:hypothetical protein
MQVMRRFTVWALSCGLMLAFFSPSRAGAETLITASEASLPNSKDIGMLRRGITRGPVIEQISPSPNVGVSSPLPFKLKFLIRNNVAIDPASVTLTYLKAQLIDLTERIKKHIAADGIDMENAEVPPGTHMLRLDLKDKQGRVGTAIIELKVAGKK